MNTKELIGRIEALRDNINLENAIDDLISDIELEADLAEDQVALGHYYGGWRKE